MIVEFAQNGLIVKTLETPKEMHLVGVKPHSTNFVSQATHTDPLKSP